MTVTGKIENKSNMSRSNYFRDAFNNLKEEVYDFDHMAEMDIVTLAHKHKMSAFEWKLNAMINKDKIGDIRLILNLNVIVFSK